MSDNLRLFGEIVSTNLAALLDDPPTREAVALVDAEREYSYGELAGLVRGGGGASRADGRRPRRPRRDRAPERAAFVAAFFGALRLGAVVVPLNLLLSPREIEERLRRDLARRAS